MTEEDQESNWLEDWHINIKKARKDLDEKFPFPAGLDREKTVASTEFFARSRMSFPYEDKDCEVEPELNPILPFFVKDYPLPIGRVAILEAYYRHRWDDGPREIMPDPLVENPDAYAGLAVLRETEKAKGWFIGLVKVTSAYTMSHEEREKLSSEKEWLMLSGAIFYEFVEGMFLIEGKLDSDLFVQLKEVERRYNEKILGKVIRGRPTESRTYSNDKFLDLNANALKGFNRRPRQEEMAELLHIETRTYKNYRERCGFKNYDSMIRYLYSRI